MYHETFSSEWPSVAIRFLGGAYFVSGAIDRQSEAYLALESVEGELPRQPFRKAHPFLT